MGLSKWIAVLSLVITYAAHAEEGGGEKAEGEKPKEKAASSTPEWMEAQTKMLGTKSKIIMKQKTIEELIQDKQKEQNPAKLREIVNDMKREHKELVTLVEEYEQERNYFRYRFPEKGLKEQQKYKRIVVKPLDDMEKEASLEGRLQHTIHKVRRQYGEAEPVAVDKTKAGSNPKKESSQSITEPAIISK